MTIKHLVISGGGPLGLRFLGALEYLEKIGYWNTNNIESIYGTSVGAIIGAFICLKYDWETLNKYIVERPWHEAFHISARQIFDAYTNKGIFDHKLAEIVFKPLLKAKDLDINITLNEFFLYSNIHFKIYTFDLNSFKTVELSHVSNPDLRLVDALTMSSSLPGIFKPIIKDGCCYIDGGVMCNYPLNHCLKINQNEEEILGIKSSYGDDDNYKNVIVTEETSILEYVISLTINSMNYIRDTVSIEDIKNTVRCSTELNPLTLDMIQESIHSQDMRRSWLLTGEEDAKRFIELIGESFP
jgi:predicted acylesterase/phospholipase RssA